MKMVLFGLAIVAVLLLYGWRFNAAAIGTKSPVITHNAKKNMIANWQPADLLDRFNGERDRRIQREQGK